MLQPTRCSDTLKRFAGEHRISDPIKANKKCKIWSAYMFAQHETVAVDLDANKK